MIEKLYLPTDTVVKIVLLCLYFEVNPKNQTKTFGIHFYFNISNLASYIFS